MVIGGVFEGIVAIFAEKPIGEPLHPVGKQEGGFF